jgi:hypothetical protein
MTCRLLDRRLGRLHLIAGSPESKTLLLPPANGHPA